MNLTVTIAPESLASIKDAVMQEIRQPSLLAPIEAPTALATELLNKHGDDIVNAIVDNHGDKLAREIGRQVGAQSVAEHIDLSDLAGEFNVRRIAEEVGVDAQDVADNIDLSELAQHIDCNTDDMAERVAGNLDLSDVARHVADEIDTEQIVEALNTKALAREIVGQFINNEEFRRSFMETLLSTLKEAVK